jgi:hypothetical protein
MFMRGFAGGAIVMGLSVLGGPAAAQGAWCSQDMNAVNCGYYTLQQCQAGVSGQGGYCIPNPFMQQSKADPRKATPRRPGRKH